MPISFLITHSGGFHADELLSSVILTRLFPNAELHRSRDQRPGPLREDGQPFSSFGLIWAHYGRDYLYVLDVPEEDIEAIHLKFDTNFVLPIDLLDNGAMEPSVAGPLAILTLPSLLGSLKPVFDDTSPTANDDAFFTALEIARSFVEAEIHSLAANARARSIVMEAIINAGSSPILELPMGIPYRSALEKSEADHILFVVNPRGDEWTLNGIKLSNDTFEQRADLPASWAGLVDSELAKVSGVEGAKFCHNALFIAVANSREAIMKMADVAVKNLQ